MTHPDEDMILSTLLAWKSQDLGAYALAMRAEEFDVACCVFKLLVNDDEFQHAFKMAILRELERSQSNGGQLSPALLTSTCAEHPDGA